MQIKLTVVVDGGGGPAKFPEPATFCSEFWGPNAPICSKIQHPPSPPGNPPGIWTFEDWLVQIPTPRGKKAVQMPLATN